MILKHLPEDFIVEEIPSVDFSENGEYSYYLLEKKNFNTEDAIQAISKLFGVPRNSFSYAGNKDKNAITRQYFSVRGRIKDIEIKDIKISKAGSGKTPISLGDLTGNKFEIVVRGIEKRPEPISEFINYFDEQRFGKNNLNVGFSIIKKKFKEAANFLDYDFVKEHLDSHPSDYVGAIRKVPFKTLKLFVHSVQSYLWNEAVFTYIQKFKHIEIKSENYMIGIPLEKIENRSLPLVSFDTSFDDFSGNLYEEVLRKNEIDARDFIIRAIPDITPKGAEREIIAKAHNLEISNFEYDEFTGKKKIRINFALDKGCYATILVKTLFYDS